MSSLSELYQNVILEHNRSPRNYRVMDDADRKADGHNPLCGDQLTVWVRMDGDVIGDVSFRGAGCAISKASASLMTGAVKGKSREEAEKLFTRFHQLVTGTLPPGESETLGKLAVFSGVSQFPVRVKCASLSWHTLKAALDGRSDGRTVGRSDGQAVGRSDGRTVRWWESRMDRWESRMGRRTAGFDGPTVRPSDRPTVLSSQQLFL